MSCVLSMIDEVGRANDQLMECDEDRQTNHEYHPALRFVKPSLRQFGLELRDYARESHPAGIRPDDRDHERRARKEKLSAQRSDIELKPRPHHNGQTPPVRDWRLLRYLVAFLPGDKSGDHRHKETMPHIGVVIPLPDQRYQNGS